STSVRRKKFLVRRSNQCVDELGNVGGLGRPEIGLRPETTHFDALHGLRGIAAVLVMLGHFSELTARHLD
ncbi:hypothetical protein, partial [Mesorhizobium sp.]|uniref:hypothetical protein n=1 Tax=Mesorhizobium sp. TaxID=1871066 RepID=UPI0025B9A602